MLHAPGVTEGDAEGGCGQALAQHRGERASEGGIMQVQMGQRQQRPQAVRDGLRQLRRGSAGGQ
eukprot:9437184-Pyramimonas_sp.AAC.1